MILLPWHYSQRKKSSRATISPQAARTRPDPNGLPGSKISLGEIPPGKQVLILDFAPSLNLERKLQLQSYGVTPGSRVEVLQHAPVTVLQIDHLELAMEPLLARAIFITEIT